MLPDLAYFGSILICLTVMAFIGVAHHKENNQPFISLLLFCLFTCLYQFFSWEFYLATTLGEAISYLRHQSSSALLLLFLLFYIVAKWTQLNNINFWVVVSTIVPTLGLGINIFSEFGFRFSIVEQLSPNMPFEGLSSKSIETTRSTSSYLIVSYACIVFLWTAYRVSYFFKQKQNLYAYSFITFIILLLSTIYLGTQIDEGLRPPIYLAGFPLTFFLLLVALSIAYQVRIKNDELIEQHKRQAQVELAMTCLAEDVSDVNNSNFYDKLTLSMQQLFQTKYVFIGMYHHDKDGARIDTLSVASHGRLEANFSYLLQDTPCYDVIGNSTCSFEDNVDKLFPKDLLLTEMGIKSYVGMPLFSPESESLGIVVLLDTKKYTLDDESNKVLAVFGARIGAELSRDQLDKKLRTMAYFDYTTRLPNRARLLDEVNTIFKQSELTNANAILMLIDLDHFKEVNRIYGYEVAEDILKEVGHRLIAYAQDNLFVARNAGDEFALLITPVEYGFEDVVSEHWHAISSIIKQTISVSDKNIKISSSAGAVLFPKQVTDKYSVIRSAETALQQAKYSGRNKYCLFDENIQKTFDHNQELLTLITHAIQNTEQVFMVYQPQTDAAGNTLGAEALIRWQSPEKGFVSPAEFIPIVEETEVVHNLGYWIIKTVFNQIRLWKKSGELLPKHISINIAAKQLSDRYFVDKLMAACLEFSINPNCIVLELTESGLLIDKHAAIETLKNLQSQGFKVALDDFGTGYSSLSYLKEMPIDILKIDKSFIDDIFTPSTLQLVQSVFSIGKHLQLEIIAEGTETLEQVQALLGIGCNCFQGYYFSKPLLPEQLVTWKFENKES